MLDLARPLVAALVRLYFGAEFRGVEHIPGAGPVLITPNHQTYADPPLVTLPIRRPVFYMAWRRLFEIPGFGWLIRRLRAFPVEIDSADTRAARTAVRLLEAGHAVMIFPEGGRSPDGTVRPFRPGAFRLAATLRVPVLPVSIAGGHACWPPGRILPRPGRITVVYHPLQWPEPGLEPRAAARELSERVRAVIVAGLHHEGTGAAA